MTNEERRVAIANGTWRAPGWVYFPGYDRDLALQSVGPGWAGIVNRLYDFLEMIPEIRVIQVKQKWAGLRVYVRGGTKAVNAVQKALLAAERESFKTCEQCGAPGTPREGGWIKTLCDADAKGRLALHYPAEDVQ